MSHEAVFVLLPLLPNSLSVLLRVIADYKLEQSESCSHQSLTAGNSFVAELSLPLPTALPFYQTPTSVKIG